MSRRLEELKWKNQPDQGTQRRKKKEERTEEVEEPACCDETEREKKKQVRAVPSLRERQREETGRRRSNLRADGAPQRSGKINLTAAASAPKERKMEEDGEGGATVGEGGQWIRVAGKKGKGERRACLSESAD